MAAGITEVTDQNFETEVLKSETPTVVDFWASWCAPCRALGPKIDQLATQFQGQVKVVKLNVDDNQQTPAKYGIRGIPTLLLFKDGKMVSQSVGDQSLANLEKFFKSAVG